MQNVSSVIKGNPSYNPVGGNSNEKNATEKCVLPLAINISACEKFWKWKTKNQGTVGVLSGKQNYDILCSDLLVTVHSKGVSYLGIQCKVLLISSCSWSTETGVKRAWVGLVILNAA